MSNPKTHSSVAPPPYRPAPAREVLQSKWNPQAPKAAPSSLPFTQNTYPPKAPGSLQPKGQPVTSTPQYELSQPLWIGNGRQQIRVNLKGSPAPIGSVDVHYDQSGKAFISDLHVAQAHRQHGLGTMLMKAAVGSAQRNGNMAAELEAKPGPGSISRQALVSMYEKIGFKSAGNTQRGSVKMSSGRAAPWKTGSR